MHSHKSFGSGFTAARALYAKVIAGDISLGGYRLGSIYGTLRCKSGKRMKPENRVFFKDENEALEAGYRPCANCMRKAYLKWKLTSNHP